MATYTGKSIIQILSYQSPISGYHNFVCADISYSVEIVVLDGNQIFSSTPSLGDAIDDNTMLIVVVNGNLTINSGVTVTPRARKRGFTLFVRGHLINNGTISMTARGANAIGQKVYLWQNKNETYEFVPVDGANGGLGGQGGMGVSGSNVGGNNGSNGTGRQTGGAGGGAGGAARGGNGASGTSYSGGSAGGGSVWNAVGGHGTINGGPGGYANRGSGAPAHSVSGGAGNPGGSGSLGPTGNTGTGGLLILFVFRLTNNGNIQSNGSGGTSANWEGGSSGGGSINIFYLNNIVQGIITANGGIRVGTSSSNWGGNGGNGTVTLNKISILRFAIFDDRGKLKIPLPPPQRKNISYKSKNKIMQFSERRAA